MQNCVQSLSVSMTAGIRTYSVSKEVIELGYDVSESLLKEIEAYPALSTDGKLYEAVFDSDGAFTGFRA